MDNSSYLPRQVLQTAVCFRFLPLPRQAVQTRDNARTKRPSRLVSAAAINHPFASEIKHAIAI
eukprot:348172-Rhodomonas_salina.2